MPVRLIEPDQIYAQTHQVWAEASGLKSTQELENMSVYAPN